MDLLTCSLLLTILQWNIISVDIFAGLQQVMQKQLVSQSYSGAMAAHISADHHKGGGIKLAQMTGVNVTGIVRTA